MRANETVEKKGRIKFRVKILLKKRRCIIMVHIVCTIENQSVHRVSFTLEKEEEKKMKEEKNIFFRRAFFCALGNRPSHIFYRCCFFWVVISFDYVSFLSIFGWFSVRVLFLSTNGKNVLKRWLLFCSSRWFFVLCRCRCLCLCLFRIFSAFNSFFFYLCVQIYNFVLPLLVLCNNNEWNPSLLFASI